MIQAPTTDLNEPATPDALPQVLRLAANRMREQAAELQSAWQDRQAGNSWLKVAKELDLAATRIEKALS